MESPLPSHASDARCASRSSIYLAATLYCDGASTPVKIRNMSATGALVEGLVVPGVGALVQLVRGGLIVHALVAWSAEDRCGLKFSGSVDVRQWRAAPTNGEQARVDEVVRLVKAGAVPLPVPCFAETYETADPGAQLSGDLRRVCGLLDKLSEVLASDPQVVTRHGPALQNLDIAIQVIAAVGALLADHKGCDTDGTKLAALRRSADQALLRGF
jgi:hypothetical protein